MQSVRRHYVHESREISLAPSIARVSTGRRPCVVHAQKSRKSHGQNGNGTIIMENGNGNGGEMEMAESLTEMDGPNEPSYPFLSACAELFRIINPRRACAARVTVVSVCLSVSPSTR